MSLEQVKTGTPTTAIFLIKNENVLTDMDTQKLRGVSKGSKVLDEADRRPTKPTLNKDDDKLSYKMNMIQYEALMDLHLLMESQSLPL